MTENSKLQKQEILLKVAQGYIDEGYEVIVAPTAEQMPNFLSAFDIDMIAMGEPENVVIEVRTRSTLTDMPRLDNIASVVEKVAGWRIDLVVNPEQTIYQLGASLNVEDIK